MNLQGPKFYFYDRFRNFSIDELLGDINWEKIRALTGTVSNANMAISIKGKTKYPWQWKI